jgi:hypothetical protein
MIIRRETLKAVLPAVTTDDTLYALHAIQIEPDGRCVATDGHILLIARDKYPQADEDFPVRDVPEFKGNPKQPILLDRTAAEKLIAAMPKKGTIAILGAAQLGTNGDGGAVISATDLQIPCIVHLSKEGQQDRKFPAYERLLPREDRPAVKVTLAVNVLQALIKAATAIQGSRRTPMGGTITFELPTEPQHQGRKPAAHDYDASPVHCDGDDCPCVHCGEPRNRHTEPDGYIIDQIRVTIAGSDDVDVSGVVMPCRL